MHYRISEPFKTLAEAIFFTERQKPFLIVLMPSLNPTKNKKERTLRHTKGEPHRAQTQLTACLYEIVREFIVKSIKRLKCT